MAGGQPNVAPLAESDAAIRVGMTQRERAETRWGLILVVFMRLLAAAWILQGLGEWTLFMLPQGSVFDHMGRAQIAAIMFFSVIDFLAAVGLWLATPWGGVLWLVAAVAQVFVAMTVPRVFSTPWLVADIVLILAYFALTFQAGRVARQ